MKSETTMFLAALLLFSLVVAHELFEISYETQYWLFKVCEELDWNFDYDCIEYLNSLGRMAMRLKIFLYFFTYFFMYLFLLYKKSLVWLQTLQGILYYLRLVKCVVSAISLFVIVYMGEGLMISVNCFCILLLCWMC